MGAEDSSRLLGKIPSRVVGKSKDEAKAIESETRLLGKRPTQEVESEVETGEERFKEGTVLIHTGRAKSEPEHAQFIITEVLTEPSGRKMFRLQGPLPTDRINKYESTLRAEIEEGKYRFKEV